jgi:4a-hydroxytetrahydrobiopterin dehydratase
VVWGAGYAAAHFLTGSFAAGLASVATIGELAATAGHDPDLDVRPEGVTVRLSTAEVQSLTTHAPDWWTLADPEGNEADLAIWG